jgi:hypothetical protein
LLLLLLPPLTAADEAAAVVGVAAGDMSRSSGRFLGVPVFLVGAGLADLRGVVGALPTAAVALFTSECAVAITVPVAATMIAA